MDLVADSSKLAGSAERGFTIRTGTTTEKINLLRNLVDSLKKSIGTALLPAINSLTDKVAPLLDRVGAWISANRELVATIVTATAVLGAGLVVFGPVLVSFGLLAGALSGLTAVLGSVPALARVGGSALTAMSAPVAGLGAHIVRLGAIIRGIPILVLTASTSLRMFALLSAARLRRLAFSAYLLTASLGPAGLLKAIGRLSVAALAAPFKMMGRGLMAAVTGVRALSVALLTNPIVLAVTAIAGAAAL